MHKKNQIKRLTYMIGQQAWIDQLKIGFLDHDTGEISVAVTVFIELFQIKE